MGVVKRRKGKVYVDKNSTRYYASKISSKMKLSLTRYRSMLTVQILLLLVDLLINTFCEYLRFESVILLVIFVIQDVCLVFSLIIVFLSFFSTYIFQHLHFTIIITKELF